MNQPFSDAYQQYAAELGRDIAPRRIPGKPPRLPLSFAQLAALPGALVGGDTVTFRGDFAGQQDMTIEENDEMLKASVVNRMS